MNRTVTVHRKKEMIVKQNKFLENLVEYVSVTRAAKKTKVGRQTVYDWINNDPSFKAKYEAANEIATERLEDEAIRRANEGVLKPVFQGGKRVGTIREFSDTLLIVLLKAKKPEKYKDRFSGEIKNTGTVQIIKLPDNGRNNNRAPTRLPTEGAK